MAASQLVLLFSAFEVDDVLETPGVVETAWSNHRRQTLEGHWTSLSRAHTMRNNYWLSSAHLQNRCILSQTALEVNDVFETPAVVETAWSNHRQSLKTRHAKTLP